MSKRVLVTGSLPKVAEEKLIAAGFDLDVYGLKDLIDEDSLIEALKDKEGYIFGGYESVTAAVIDTTKILKIIAFIGVGYENFVDARAATRKGIAVTNTPGANKYSVAEMTIGLMLAAARNIPFFDASVRSGKWETSIPGQELRGKTLGIVGIGAIGERVAEIAHLGLGMTIVYYSRSRKENVEERLNARRLPLDELCQISDVVSLHVSFDPANPATAGIMGAHELSQMKPTGILINTARPELVDGNALYLALHEGRIAKAAFDGFYTEPDPPTADNDSTGLMKLDSTSFIITPHVAWNTPAANDEAFLMAAKSVIDVLNGHRSPQTVNI